MLFEKFGEFDSVEELNAAADGLLNEGDIESLKELAKENGIDKEDVQDYIEGLSENLATVSSAAFGRLFVEEKQAKTSKGEEMIAQVLFTMARSLCLKDSFCRAVMQKEKRLMTVYKLMRDKVSKQKSNGIGVLCGTDRGLSNLITTYYMHGEDELKRMLDELC